MNRSTATYQRMKALLRKMMKGLLLYMLAPALCLIWLWNPAGDAVRGSDGAAYWILLGALGAVGINWAVYAVIRRKPPSLLVLAHGMFCLLLTVIMEAEALPGYDPLVTTLAVIGGCLVLTMLFLLHFWFAAKQTKATRIITVGLRLVIGAVAFLMAAQVARDIEIGKVTRDTWISIVILVALIPAAFIRRIRKAIRNAAFHRRATAQTPGKIVQLLGETHLDLDGDAVTEYLARIRYTAGEKEYEIRSAIKGFTMRLFGRESIVGLAIPVYYDPEKPEEAYTRRIDRYMLKKAKEERDREEQ